MELFEGLISYFCEYDLYNNILSNTMKDRKAKDILLGQFTFDFASQNMVDSKVDKIWDIIKNKLEYSQRASDKK